MRTLAALIVIAVWTAVIFPQGSPLRWRQASFQDFVRGTFSDGGSNMYVSAKGRVQTIARWDLNNDGYQDLTFSNTHPHSEKLDPVIFWGNGKTFDNARTMPIPANGSQWTIPCDVDGDGHVDLLVPNYQNGTYDKMDSYLYFNAGQKQPDPGPHPNWYFFPFHRRVAFPTQAAEYAACGDLNRDGFMDVVFAFSGGFWEYRDDPWNAYQKPSRIYWGSKDGFSPDRYTEIPTMAASSVAIADLNHDGWPELIVASNEVAGKKDVDSHIYWGGPKGFSAEHRTGLPTRSANMVRVADVNKDGYPDIAFANGVGNTSYLYLGGKDGYSPSRRIELETHDAVDVQIADVNRDGWPDIFFSNNEIEGNPDTYSYLYYGSPKGFSNDRRFAFETVGAWGSALADLNEDGWPDVVVANFKRNEYFDISSYIYWNSPKGFDLTRRTPLFTHGAQGVAVADFNGDGHLDILFNNTTKGYRGNFHPMAIYWGNPTGQFSAEHRTLLPAVDAYQVSPFDLNDDGYPDLIVGNSGETGRINQEAYIYWGEPGGYDIDHRSGVMAVRTLGYGVADLDRDGYLDIIMSNYEYLGDKEPGIFIYWGGPDGYSPLNVTILPGDGAEHAVAADFNNDGNLDILVGGEKGDRGAMIYWGDGTRKYTKERRTIIPGSRGGWQPNAADLNGDGYLDLILPRSGYEEGRSTTSLIYWGNAKGEYTEKNRLELPTVGAGRATVADLNQDGWLDLVFPAYSTGTSRNTMSRIFFGGPEGYSAKHMQDLPTYGGTGALANDFNHDGYVDLLLVCHRREGDPEKTGSYGEHMTSSFLYWGGPNGFSPDRRLEIPTEGAHDDAGVDMGNLYDRKFAFAFTSSPYNCGPARPKTVSWGGEARFGSKMLMQLRTAGSEAQLKSMPWMGPHGQNTYYEHSGAELKGVEGPWIQYRVTFTSPDGVTYPVLDNVEVVFDRTE